jgi:hypothetical protein
MKLVKFHTTNLLKSSAVITPELDDGGAVLCRGSLLVMPQCWTGCVQWWTDAKHNAA